MHKGRCARVPAIAVAFAVCAFMAVNQLSVNKLFNLAAAVASAVVGVVAAVVLADRFGISFGGGVVLVVVGSVAALYAVDIRLADILTGLSRVLLMIEVISNLFVTGAEMAIVRAMIILEYVIIAEFITGGFFTGVVGV